jgi:pyruvate dehydrogenase E2 component (dihydrolipoamide acetyltransferase)
MLQMVLKFLTTTSSLKLSLLHLAIDIPDGVVAPAIKNVTDMSLNEIAAASAAIVDKAQSGKLDPDDLEDACITISNLGAFGADRFIPIVIPGQCSILGIGKITDTLLPEETGHHHEGKPEILVRKIMAMTLSVDHRIANGSYAARFLDFARKQLEDASNFK